MVPGWIATFIHSSIDRPPEGDIPGVISLLAGANPDGIFYTNPFGRQFGIYI
jgi:hypothetical protein